MMSTLLRHFIDTLRYLMGTYPTLSNTYTYFVGTTPALTLQLSFTPDTKSTLPHYCLTIAQELYETFLTHPSQLADTYMTLNQHLNELILQLIDI